MDLTDEVRQAFDAEGVLARADAGYRPREVQLELALAVARAIDERGVLVAEAGTGVGKTFAYLVPTLLSGRRALVSTATKSLQDQLFLRDLPRLRGSLNVPVSLALLKGRGSYLCLHRLEQAREEALLSDRTMARALARIEQWAQATNSGDLAELPGLDERSPIIPLVTSTRDNCLGAECPQAMKCHVLKARRDAMAADVVVVNHHLFFADVALRDSGVAELLPSVDVAVFDEAHQLAEAGVQFLGSTLGSGQLLDFTRDLLAAGLKQARGLVPWNELAGHLEHAARDLRLVCAGPLRDTRGSLKLRWEERAARPEFDDMLTRVAASLEEAVEALDTVSELSPDFVRLAERASDLSRLATRFTAPAADGRIRWIELSAQQARLTESPLDIRDALNEQRQRAPKAWVFTSATLGDDDRLSWFTASAGLEQDAVTLRVGSPFDYAENARVWVPSALPRPNDPSHPSAVAKVAAACVRALRGRTFVLTTTLRALQQVGAQLQEALADDGIDVLVQGQSPKRELMRRFVGADRGDAIVPLPNSMARGAVLVGSQTFWEGIDVPGDALQCVIIDKLPFPPPNDPLVEARVKKLESEGRNAFNDYFIAEAAVSLKQGAGRLIRSETDRGLLVVCDPRLTSMSYGRRLLSALPPMTKVASRDEALAWLAELALAHC